MKKVFKKLSTMIITAVALVCLAIPVFAEAPKDNGSSAKAALAEEIGTQPATQSEAFPAWIIFSSIGAVAVIGITVGAIVIGKKSGEDSKD